MKLTYGRVRQDAIGWRVWTGKRYVPASRNEVKRIIHNVTREYRVQYANQRNARKRFVA